MILDLRSVAVKENPYPFYADLRRASRVCRVEPFGFYGLLHYEDVVAAMKNVAVFSSEDIFKSFPKIPGADFLNEGRSLLTSDPPRHTQLRKVINGSFTPQAMRAWEPRVTEVIDDLVDSLLAHSGPVDFIREFAVTLPVLVISELMGIDSERRADFKRWSDDIVTSRSTVLIADPERRRARENEIAQSCREMEDYFSQVIERRRTDRGSDLVSLLLQAADDGVPITTAELLSLCRLLLVAGNETTTNLLGNALLVLDCHPAELAKVLASPRALVPNAIEEVLRYEGPVLNVTRRVLKDVTIGDTLIPAGSTVLPFVASANRDEKKFADPEVFDVQRNALGHVAFGFGIHFCVGAPLARLETRLALTSLFERITSFRVVDTELHWLESFGIRGLKSLRIELQPASTTVGRTASAAPEMTV